MVLSLKKALNTIYKIVIPVFACLILIIYPLQLKAQSNQTVVNGATTAPIVFPGQGCTYNWVNDNPAIGLPANGIDNIASFTATNTTNSSITATITATPTQANFLYVSNTLSNFVSVINAITNKLVATIAVPGPGNIIVSHSGKLAYVVSYSTYLLYVINTITNTIVTTVPVGSNPIGLCISPDDSRLYITNYLSNTVSVVDASNNTVISTISNIQNPGDIVISNDGKLIFVNNLMLNTITVINTTNGNINATITAGMDINYMVLNPAGNRLFVASRGSILVTVINTSDYTILANILNVSTGNGIAVSPNGNFLYVANTLTNNVTIINTQTNTAVTMVNVGKGPGGIVVSPDGKQVYVANSLANTVSVINTQTNLVSATIPVGNGPSAVTISAGPGCTGAPITFTVTVNPSPVINITGNIAPLNTTYGTASLPGMFTVSGDRMQAGILITPPNGFELSTNNLTYNNTLTIGSTGTMPGTVIYARLTAHTPVGFYADHITLASTGAVSTAQVISGTVSPAPLTVTADDKSREFGAPNPVFTLTYSGFVNNETAAQLSVVPAATTTATINAPIGLYPITVGGGMAANYTFSYVPGVLTIYPPLAVPLIPNAFTPNNDGINDTWNINLAAYPNCTVAIFNRYGEQLFFSKGYPAPWNARYKGMDISAGTYYYIINLDAKSKPLSGSVTVIR